MTSCSSPWGMVGGDYCVLLAIYFKKLVHIGAISRILLAPSLGETGGRVKPRVPALLVVHCMYAWTRPELAERERETVRTRGNGEA